MSLTWQLLHGDVRDRLKELPAGSVQMVCTSPPYWGLRDYGTATWDGGDSSCDHLMPNKGQRQDGGRGNHNGGMPGFHGGTKPEELSVIPFRSACGKCGAVRIDNQLGLEPTPDAFVASMVSVFAEVHRVLADDGVVFLNLGDSYAGNNAGGFRPGAGRADGIVDDRNQRNRNGNACPSGLKPKDLCGIPWMVAKALQAPRYTGRITKETDRAWLAAFIESEGTITYIERDRGEGRTPTHDIRVFVTNCDRLPLDEFSRLTAGHVYEHENGQRDNRFGSRPCFRWQMGTHDSALLLREVYPYLRMKRKQAALVWTLFTTLRHQNGHAKTPDDVIEKRREIASRVCALNAGESVDLPEWVEEPPPCYEPGWYLRSDIIWAKKNCMPESVTDRPTKSHEYIFLLTKSPTYYYDAEAIKEPPAESVVTRSSYKVGGVKRDSSRNDNDQGQRSSFADYLDGRNKRSVWTIATQPFEGAHFAVFPEALVEPCILAGSKPGDLILDPFCGSGTTLAVAIRLGRNAVGIELNATYCELARKRINAVAPLFAQEIA